LNLLLLTIDPYLFENEYAEVDELEHMESPVIPPKKKTKKDNRSPYISPHKVIIDLEAIRKQIIQSNCFFF
jgi:hypothetical protein